MGRIPTVLLGRAPLKRPVNRVRIQSTEPSKGTFSAASGNQAAVTRYCRKIERSDEDGFTPKAILSALVERTLKRMQAQQDVLLLETGSDLNFDAHRGGSGLGVLSRINGKAETMGTHLRGTFAVRADGIPLVFPASKSTAVTTSGTVTSRPRRAIRHVDCGDGGTVRNWHGICPRRA